jgi:tRNA pseudouridine55 synthase
MKLEGILPVWKPAGMTSHDVVARVRRITREKRIGHTGTLDPQVTGVLPLCIGAATRLVEFVQELPKTYTAKLVFGIATDTEDMTGTVIARENGVRIDPELLRRTIESFLGPIEQVPPMYSAVKVDGKRLYEIARSGAEVERKPRTVTIHDIRLVSAQLQAEFPEAELEAVCSKGTYIRTLCVDIGKKLGVPAAMKELVRTKTGHWTRETCLTLEQIDDLMRSGELADRLVPMAEAVGHLPAVALDERQTEEALQGKKLRLPNEQASPLCTASIVRAHDEDGHFIGLFTWNGDEKVLVPNKVFVTSYER